MTELKSLTLEETKYDSFVDETARTAANEARTTAEEAKRIAQSAGGGTGTSVVFAEPMEDDIPKVFITGVKPTTKDDVLAEMQYISKTDNFYAYLIIKCQGSSSMSYAKKNFTIKLYSDEARESKLKKEFKDWNYASNKFVLKANWIDHSHARNIVSARIWDEVVKSRQNYSSLPTEMRNSPQSGAIDGFPVKLYYNGTYEGLYTWNIGKDAWMWGMDEDNPKHTLLSCGYNDNGKLLEKAGNFRALWSGIHEDNWDIEVGTQGDALTASLNALISCVKDTDDETFKATIGTYLDIESALDYYLYFWANAGLDSLENNMLLATYDGVKWICGAYDMDSVWGLFFNGSKFISTTFKCPDQYQGPYSLLWERITKLFIPELQARYAELRSNILSYANIVTHFERFMDVIGSELYAEDLTIYTGIPSGSTNNIKQIRNYVRDRLAYVDTEVANMGNEQPDTPDTPEPSVIPCTGITLDNNELTFTTHGRQTLTATITPNDCTDTVAWTTDDASIATVKNGIVTAVGNGSTIIRATCGAYSASCSVSVSGIEIVNINLTSGKAVNPQGTVIDYSGTWVTEDITEVSSDYIYTITPVEGHTEINIHGYNENGEYEEAVLKRMESDLATSYDFVVSERVKGIRITIYGEVDSPTVLLKKSLCPYEIPSYQSRTKTNEGTGKQIFISVMTLEWITPRYIELEAGANYTIDMGEDAIPYYIYSYDANYAYIGRYTGATCEGGVIRMTTPDNAKYIRIYCKGTPSNEATIVKE